MTLADAQKTMRAQYIDGAPGVLISGLVWLIAGLTAQLADFRTSIIVFFFGGMLIHPLATFISKKLQRTERPSLNPLNTLALEGTILLFAGLFIAFTISKSAADLFYPVMLLVIGARYLTFQTLYGLKTYWILGGILMAVGMLSILVLAFPLYAVPLAGGVIEIIMAGALFKGRAKAPA